MSPARDRKPLTEAQRDLAVAYIPLARSIARPFMRRWPAFRDDFESAACLALVEVAGSFDPARKVKFATFAQHRIWGALCDFQRSFVALGWRRNPTDAPRVGPLPGRLEGEGRVLGAEPDDPIGSEIEAADSIDALLRKLPRRHAEVCRLIYLEGKSQHEAARTLGGSQACTSRTHGEALSILNGSWDARVRAEGA